MADMIYTVNQLINELSKYNHIELHVHNTVNPNHKDWRKRPDARYWQNVMRSTHKRWGWSDIGQHVTLTPDGKFISGRNFSRQPASCVGYNQINGQIPFMVEMLGNFNKGNDTFGGVQKDSMLKLAKWFYDRGKRIRFHREMDKTQTCPGNTIDKGEFMQEVKGKIAPEKPKVITPSDTFKPNAKVTNVKTRLNVRAKPNGAKIGWLHPNERVQILSTTGNWYLVRYKIDGTNRSKQGYVSAEYVQMLTSQKGQVYNVKTRLNVRDKPEGKKIGWLHPNEKVEIRGQTNGWYLVEYIIDGTNRRKQGWVSAKYIKLI